jgi:hypothetical protein
MPVARLRVDPGVKGNLGAEALASLRRELRAVDCQTCGRAFGRWEAAALTVEAVGDDAVASLHHPKCAPPGWRDVETTDRLRQLPHQTWRAALLTLAAHGHDDLMFLVNPAYEVARLTREAGRWQVSTMELFAHCGLGLERLDGVIPLPALSALVDTDRLTVDVSLLGTVVERWDLSGPSFPPQAAAVLATKDWLTILVTMALDAGETIRHNPVPSLLKSKQVRLGAAAVHYTEAAQRPRPTDFAEGDRWPELLALIHASVELATGAEPGTEVLEAAMACCHGDSGPITQLPPQDRTVASAFVAQSYEAQHGGGVHVMVPDAAAAAVYRELFAGLSEMTGSSAALLTREPGGEEILAEFEADVVIGTPEQFVATYEQHRQNAGDWGPDETRARLALTVSADARRRAGELLARYPRTAIV